MGVRRRRGCSSIVSWKMNGHWIALLPHSLAKQTRLCKEGGRAESPSVNCRRRLGDGGAFLSLPRRTRASPDHPIPVLRGPCSHAVRAEDPPPKGRLETGAENSSLTASSPLHCRGRDVLMGRAGLGRMARLLVPWSSAALRPRHRTSHVAASGLARITNPAGSGESLCWAVRRARPSPSERGPEPIPALLSRVTAGPAPSAPRNPPHNTGAA
ncbi:hypothetical protein KIL84_004429 [Mauremys mutica]|uniref:Uncharacterized protein n=1 Tax=Mauremys mutica TaxID=74926 RepID=A0A9D4B008_9SAUR|nr:hypothetical protein KIL84_004429 [Mauremys mutica]